MSIPSLFIRTAVLLGLAGMLLGIFMGINQDFRLAHFHAHWNLLGWVAFFIYGAYYALVPAARQGVLPKAHYVLALLGLKARDVMGVTFTVFVVLFPLVLVLVTVLGGTLAYPL